MQIGTSLFYDRTSAQMTSLAEQSSLLNTQIATGKKLSAPSQDVVAYDRLTSIKQATADQAAYAGNISLATSLLQQSDSTLTQVSTQLQRASELTIRANTGTLNDTDRKTIAIEMKNILNDLVSLANTNDARGQPLFGAASGTSAVTQAADGTVSFGGTGEIPPIPVGDGTAVAASDSAERVFGNIPTSTGGKTDVFAILSSYITALDTGGDISAASATTTDALDIAQTQVNSVQGSVGARGARLDIVSAQATDAAVARESDRTGLEDTDLSTAITQLQKTMTILSATQASFSKLSGLSLFSYLR